jgi:hypothetical protein
MENEMKLKKTQLHSLIVESCLELDKKNMGPTARLVHYLAKVANNGYDFTLELEQCSENLRKQLKELDDNSASLNQLLLKQKIGARIQNLKTRNIYMLAHIHRVEGDVRRMQASWREALKTLILSLDNPKYDRTR